jgi:hypothetical protein
LKEIDRFGPFLAEWQAAVRQGPWPFPALDFSSATPLISEIVSVGRLLGLKLAAELRTGDPAAAWQSLQTLADTADRAGDARSLIGFAIGTATRRHLLNRLPEGLGAGGWTDGQLREFPSLITRTDVFGAVALATEEEQAAVDRLLGGLAAGDGTLEKVFFGYAPSVGAKVAAFFTTSQQLRDNADIIKWRIDQSLDAIDFESRTLRASVPATSVAGATAPSSNWFSQFYYRYADVAAPIDLATPIARAQTDIDHALIAVALEQHRRATGAYPAALPAEAPHDVATGEPYRYEATGDGGYRLWGAGADRSDDGGNEKKDIVWPAPR